MKSTRRFSRSKRYLAWIERIRGDIRRQPFFIFEREVSVEDARRLYPRLHIGIEKGVIVRIEVAEPLKVEVISWS